MASDLSAFPCLQNLPTCFKCQTPLPFQAHFLLLICGDIICSKCIHIPKMQAFCDLHKQQSIGEVLDEVESSLQQLRLLLRKEGEVDLQQQVQELAELITSQLTIRKERMEKFRKRSIASIKEQEDTQLTAIQEKFSSREPVRLQTRKAKTEAVLIPKPRLTTTAICPFCRQTEPSADCPTCGSSATDWQNVNICKICFRLNADDIKICPGCKQKNGLVVWLCRGCGARNENGVIPCQECGREDEFQSELFNRGRSHIGV